MSTMKDFHASIASGAHPQGSYQEALAKITRLNHRQTSTLLSDLGWQTWGERDSIPTDPA